MRSRGRPKEFACVLTILENFIELRSAHHRQAISDDGTGGIVAVVVDKDLTHVGDARVECWTCVEERVLMIIGVW